MRAVTGTLRFRVTALVLVSVLVSASAALTVMYQLQRYDVQQQVENDTYVNVVTDAAQAEERLAAGSAGPAVDVAAQVVMTRRSRFAVFEVGHAAAGRYGGLRPRDLPRSLVDVRPADNAYADVRLGRETYVADARRMPTHSDVVIVELYDVTLARYHLQQLRRDAVAAVAIAAAIATAIGAWGATTLVRPLRLAARTTRDFGNGDLQARITRKGTGEFAALASSFNAMADALSTAWTQMNDAHAQQKRFVADVSHELRTPLAALSAACGGLGSERAGDRARAVDLVTAQAARMNRLVEDLLEISRLDAGEAQLDLERCDVARLAQDAAATVAPGEVLHVTILGDPSAVVDPRRVHAVLRNLVSNALHHGRAPVELTVDGRAQPLVVTVIDEGDVVRDAVADLIFDRFVRGRSSRTTRHANTGLGLAIARENAALHGGTLTYARTDRTVFTLTLPRPE